MRRRGRLWRARLGRFEEEGVGVVYEGRVDFMLCNAIVEEKRRSD